MKQITLSADTVINGKIRIAGELVRVPDNWTENIRREVAKVNPAEVEQRREKKIEQIKEEKERPRQKEKEREPKEPPVRNEPPVDEATGRKK